MATPSSGLAPKAFARAGLKVKRIGDAYMKLAVPRPGESAASSESKPAW